MAYDFYLRLCLSASRQTLAPVRLGLNPLAITAPPFAKGTNADR